MGSAISQRIAFVGAGRMATALARGMIAARLVEARQLAASDPAHEAAAAFGEATGVTVHPSNRSAVAAADVVVLAVKPQHMAAVLADLRGEPTAGKLVVSIAAGITLAALAEGLGAGARLVRVMPNTPCLVGEGASAFCLGPGATEADAALVQRLLAAVGQAHRVPESLLDAVTGLSGSGPAFVCLFLEALSDGGVKMGLPRAVAAALAAQTVRGTAAMVLSTGEHPATLKDQVASPGGTTIAGLHALERGGLRAAVISAVEAATVRSAELGNKT
jgi:pyrroline-5-carboxylate reductase